MQLNGQLKNNRSDPLMIWIIFSLFVRRFSISDLSYCVGFFFFVCDWNNKEIDDSWLWPPSWVETNLVDIEHRRCLIEELALCEVFFFRASSSSSFVYRRTFDSTDVGICDINHRCPCSIVILYSHCWSTSNETVHRAKQSQYIEFEMYGWWLATDSICPCLVAQRSSVIVVRTNTMAQWVK